MPATVVHPLDSAWTSSSAALQITVEAEGPRGAGTSMRLRAPLGAAGATATYAPPAPLDLSAYDELRFWVRADRRADGSPQAPFWLELSYRDAADLPTDGHRWLIAVNAAGAWEQRRIGIAGDRRTAIDRLRLTALDDRPFSVAVDELLAVDERMLTDLEDALAELIRPGLDIPGLVGLPATSGAAAGTISVAAAAPFAVGNRVRVDGVAGGPTHHTVTMIAGTGPTVLTVAPPAPALGAGATVTVEVPVVFEAAPTPVQANTPSVIVTALGAVEDSERTRNTVQRDSFRDRGGLVACSVRPGARAYLADYQIAVVAPDRRQQAAITDALFPRFSDDVPVYVNGTPWPLWVMPALPLLNRAFGTLAPSLYIRIGARAEIAPRTEAPWIRSMHIGAGRPDAPADTEAIVIEL